MGAEIIITMTITIIITMTIFENWSQLVNDDCCA